MPETNIDQSAGITSIRLKVPTGTVPIPPAGFGQLHSPSPGTLALRLPDGSVVEIGGGGGGTPAVLAGTGGVVEALSNPFTGAGVTISPAPGETIFLNGPVVGPGADQPFGVQVAAVPISSAELLDLGTEKVLVPSPGPVVLLVPLDTVFLFTAGDTAYVVGSGSLLAVGLAAGSGQEGLAAVATEGLIDGLADTVASVSSGGLRPDLVSSAAGEPIVLSVLFGGAPTVGNGSLVVVQTYLAVAV